MSNSQFMIYNTDDGGLVNQTFVADSPMLIRAAGLQECVKIFMMVGTCYSCQPKDVLWEPIYTCGKAVELCPDNNTVIIKYPGKYSIGDPNENLVLQGDVNITAERNVDVGEEENCKGVTIVNRCENAVPITTQCDIAFQEKIDRIIENTNITPEPQWMRAYTLSSNPGFVQDIDGTRRIHAQNLTGETIFVSYDGTNWKEVLDRGFVEATSSFDLIRFALDSSSSAQLIVVVDHFGIGPVVY